MWKRGESKCVRSAEEGGGGQHGGAAPTARFYPHSRQLSPVTTLGMLCYHCDGSSRDPRLTDRRKLLTPQLL